jgi:hypothetical protein
MVELVGALDRLPQRQVARQYHVFSPQRNEQRALRGPRADAGNGGECRDELVVRQPAQRIHVQPPIRQPLGEVTECADLPP